MLRGAGEPRAPLQAAAPRARCGARARGSVPAGAVGCQGGGGDRGVALCQARSGQGLWAGRCLLLINRMDFAHFSPVLL